MNEVMSSRPERDLEGLRILITAGPTVEDIDPVRFISNRSSGRMGIALATAAAQRDAEVLCVHGPLTAEFPEHKSVRKLAVRSAAEMYAVVMDAVAGFDVAILAAAVADYTPLSKSRQKIKKDSTEFASIELKRTKDILASIGQMPQRPFLVGFAAESENLIENARDKLARKCCDMICANSISGSESAFGSQENRVVIIDSDGNLEETPMQGKVEVAHAILDRIRARLQL